MEHNVSTHVKFKDVYLAFQETGFANNVCKTKVSIIGLKSANLLKSQIVEFICSENVTNVKLAMNLIVNVQHVPKFVMLKIAHHV